MPAQNHLLGGDSDSPLDVGEARDDSPPADEAHPPGEPSSNEQASRAPAVSGLTSLERKLAAEAYKKVLGGQQLTQREQTALKRFEKEKEERLRWQYYAAIPQKHWREMSGRQTKVINEQALRYQMPFGGAVVNLPAVVRALHDFLADNAHKLAKDDDALMQGTGSPALERYREERALMARLDRLQREQQLLPRDEVREALARIATILRGAGETLQRQFGQGAADILYEALDDGEREIGSAFGESPESEDPCDQPLTYESESSGPD